MQRSKVPSKLLLFFNPDILEVLVTEDYDASFGDEKGEFVLLLVRQLRQLQATNLGANGWSNFGNLDSWNFI